MHRATKRFLYITLFVEVLLVGMWVRSLFYVDSAFLNLRTVGSIAVFCRKGQTEFDWYDREWARWGVGVRSDPLAGNDRGLRHVIWAPRWVRVDESFRGVLPSYSLSIPYWMWWLAAATPLVVHRVRTKKRKEARDA